MLQVRPLFFPHTIATGAFRSRKYGEHMPSRSRPPSIVYTRHTGLYLVMPLA